MIFDLFKTVEWQEQAIRCWFREHVEEHDAAAPQKIVQGITYANCCLWTLEDKARDYLAQDLLESAGTTKREIDECNQQRNNAIQAFDRWLVDEINHLQIRCFGARLYTETVGSVIDRLSILQIRLLHLGVENRGASSLPAICRTQLQSLRQAGQQLVNAIYAGETQPIAWDPAKLYNDDKLRAETKLKT